MTEASEFLEDCEGAVSDLGLLLAFEPEQKVEYYLHLFCENVRSRLAHARSIPVADLVEHLAARIRARKLQIEIGVAP